MEHDFKALALAKKLGDPLKLCYGNDSLARCYYYMGDYNASLKYARMVIKIMEPLHRKDTYWMWIQMAKAFHSMNQPILPCYTQKSHMRSLRTFSLLIQKVSYRRCWEMLMRAKLTSTQPFSVTGLAYPYL